jgi:hypothetical protein
MVMDEYNIENKEVEEVFLSILQRVLFEALQLWENIYLHLV